MNSLWGYKEEDVAGGLVYIDATVAEEFSRSLWHAAIDLVGLELPL